MTLEDARVPLRQKLEDAYGVEEASILLDRPPGGWSDLVANRRSAGRTALLGPFEVADQRGVGLEGSTDKASSYVLQVRVEPDGET